MLNLLSFVVAKKMITDAGLVGTDATKPLMMSLFLPGVPGLVVTKLLIDSEVKALPPPGRGGAVGGIAAPDALAERLARLEAQAKETKDQLARVQRKSGPAKAPQGKQTALKTPAGNG